MIFYIKLMLCVILTGVAIIVLQVLLQEPVNNLKHLFEFKSFRRKINIGRFTEEELLIIKDEIKKALTIQGYVNEFVHYEEE